MVTTLIFGINGQSGSFCADLLLEKGYEVHGVIRRSSNFNTERIDHIFDKLKLHYGDVTDAMNVFSVISNVKPNEIYNFSAQSHVKVGSELENYTFQVNTIGVLNILQSVRNLGLLDCKIYQASTSEIFGNQTDGSIALNEESPQSPCSIYGISKYAAQQICNMYRDAYGMFIVNSLIFNHESPRRGHTFVTQKIANYVAKFSLGQSRSEPLKLGNLNAKRDWGHAKDYVYAIYLMMQQECPKNYVIASNEAHSVREFVELAFKEIGICIFWEGSGLQEKGVTDNGTVLVEVDPRYFRDIEVHALLGNSTRAQRELGWKLTVTFPELVSEMVQSAIIRNLELR